MRILFFVLLSLVVPMVAPAMASDTTADTAPCTTGVEPSSPETATEPSQALSGVAGPYGSYSSAYRVACYYRDCGYRAYICQRGCYYYVCYS